MTLRLSGLFEEQLKKIFKRSSSKFNRSARGRNERGRPSATTSYADTNGGPSTSRHARVRRNIPEEEEEVDVVNGEMPSTSTGRPMRQIRARQSNQITNGVSSSHNDAGPSGYRNKRTRRLQSDNDSDMSSESSDSESSNETENYEPTEPKCSRKTAKKKKEKRTNEATSKRPRRLQLHESSDEEQPQEETAVPVSSQNGRRTRGRPRKNQISDDESGNEGVQNESEDDEEEEEVQDEQQSEDDEEESEEEQVEEESYRPRRTTRQSPSRSSRRSQRHNQSNNSEDSDAPLRPKPNASKHDSFDESNVQISTSTRRTVTSSRVRRQVLNDSTEGSPGESARPIRSTRQTPTSSRNNGTENQDSDDDSDDDQLLSQIANQNRSKQSPRRAPPISTEFVDTTSPVHQNGNPLQRTREMIRRKQSSVSSHSSTTVVATSQSGYHSVTRSKSTAETTSQIEIRRSQVQEDHNYGEPGPSTLRHSRRVNQLSRHQQIPDEHNKSHGSIVECPVDPLRVPESISGRLRTRTPKSNPNADNDSDPDDDKPLHLMVTESPTRSRPSRQSTRYSDEHVSQSQAGSSSAATSSTRSSRMQKRPHYNEDSDEEDNHLSKRQATQGRYVYFIRCFSIFIVFSAIAK